jgi:hypothetical protein
MADHTGPMVYAAAYCPMSFKATLEEMGFDGMYIIITASCSTVARGLINSQTRRFLAMMFDRDCGIHLLQNLLYVIPQRRSRLRVSQQEC